MPPPKKPKQGVTRVDQFLSAEELQELQNKCSNNPGGQLFVATPTRHTDPMHSEISSSSPVSSPTPALRDTRETTTHSLVNSHQKDAAIKKSDILHSLLNGQSSDQSYQHSTHPDRASRPAEYTAHPECASRPAEYTAHPECASSTGASSDSDNSQDRSAQSTLRPNSGSAKRLVCDERVVKEMDQPAARHAPRKLESLMMKRKLNSLMDVPRHTFSTDPLRSTDSTSSLSSSHCGSTNSCSSLADSSSSSSRETHADGSSEITTSTAPPYSSSQNKRKHDKMSASTNGHNNIYSKLSYQLFKNEGQSTIQHLPTAARAPSTDHGADAATTLQAINNAASLNPMVNPFLTTHGENSLFNHRQSLPRPSLPLLGIAPYTLTQAADEIFLASQLRKNLLNRQGIQDSLARLQMSGRPAFASLVRPVRPNVPRYEAASSGENKNHYFHSDSKDRSLTRPSKASTSQKNQEPQDIEYETSASSALQSARPADHVTSSSSGNTKHENHSLSSQLTFDYSHTTAVHAHTDRLMVMDMPAIMRSVSAPCGNMPSQPEMPSSTMTDPLRKNMDDKGQVRRCQICNDNASGFHYGVWSCEGCKAFFKRSLQGPVDYVCPATNSCTIDKHRRKSCQACRLRKCVEMGMSRGSCRKERRSSGPRAMKHKASDVPLDNSDASPSKKHLNSELLKTSLGRRHDMPDSKSSTGMSSSSSAPVLSLPRPHINSPHQVSNSFNRGVTGFTPCHATSQMAVISPFRTSSSNNEEMAPPAAAFSRHASPSTSRQQRYDCLQNTSSRSNSQNAVHSLVEHLLRIDPAARQSGHEKSKDDNELSIMSSIFSLCDMELHDIIVWAKSIPGYTELDLADKIHLLECCWMEILLMGLIWRSMHKSHLCISSDLLLDKDRLEKANFSLIGSQILACVKQFEKLELKREEFVLIRCAILLNSDLVELHNVDKIEALKKRIMEAMQYTVLERNKSESSRLVQILMILPHTRQVAMQLIQHLLSPQLHTILTKFELLREMVEAFVKVVGIEMPNLAPETVSGNNALPAPANNSSLVK